jgi:hypothetical protein
MHTRLYDERRITHATPDTIGPYLEDIYVGQQMNLSTLTAELAGKTTLQQRHILERWLDRDVEMRSMICDIDADAINLDFIGAGRKADTGDWNIQVFFERERFGKELLAYAYGDDVEIVAKLRSAKPNYVQCLEFELQSIRKTGTTARSRYEARAKATSRCFIATAAYDSSSATQVVVLREFRDDILIRSLFGRCFVRIYERLSPAIAVVVGRRSWLRTAVRVCISPIVWGITRLRG